MTSKSQSGEAEMQTVEFSQVIERPVSDVFEFMAEHHVQNQPRWDENIELELESEGPTDVGTAIRRRNTPYEEPVEGDH